MRNIYIETYGCQMNEYDTGVVESILNLPEFARVDDPDQADILLFNTCAVRERAQERIFGRIDNFAHLKRKNPGTIIGLMGCVAQSLKDEILHKNPAIDLVVGPDNYRDLPELLQEIESGDQLRISRTILSKTETYEDILPTVTSGVLAFVTVMRGCNNFCSFCVVPYTRGRERSRSPESVINEINHLVESEHVKEVTLLGQNVNSYKYGRTDFSSLIRLILEQTDVQRIRFTSPHPHDFPEQLLELMASEKRVCSHIHLPLQSGSTEILKRMRRDYTAEKYLNLVNLIRSYDPGMGLSTDIIAGFPGETNQDHEHTLELMRTIRFDMAFMFQYSQRPHTSAFKSMTDDVLEEEKKIRLQQIIQLQSEIAETKNRSLHGQTLEVLVEKRSRKNQDQWMGRTTQNKVVIFDQDPGAVVHPGQLLNIHIASSTSATLLGNIV